MSRHRIAAFARSTRTMAMSVLVVAGVTLSACGPLGDDDSDPTATSETIEQPTTASTEESAATEASTDTQADGTPVETPDESTIPSTPRPFDRGTPVTANETEATTEVVSVSTPVLDLETDEDAAGTPVTDDSDPLATPDDDAGDTESTETATEEAGDENDSTSASSFSGSDGTSGATPHADSEEESTDTDPEEGTPFFVRDDPTPTPTPEEATPVGEGTPVVGDDATIDDLVPAEATSCEPENIPEITIDQVSYLTSEDVNFRTGPGADCDLINTIGINAEVTLLGGPVTREDDDFVWVQVEIAGDTGWIITEVLDPAG